jgi:hypothetical protein
MQGCSYYNDFDMTFIRLRDTDGVVDYFYYMGGSDADYIIDASVQPDTFVYSIGSGYSSELVGGDFIGIFIIKYTQEG